MRNVTGSVVESLYGGYTAPAAVPAMSGIPEGPHVPVQPSVTVPGIVAVPAGRAGLHAAAIGTAALVVLGLIWLALPS